ncbi:hypothetical protein K488DRAFT_55521 [Vararia minispora EC-137]|uniref:Uncharacterized protein n=1 Tax=Vararia minispora EC-137 TaxID=1314806 RepID=A0ACB8QDJ9_9AGAM|nr:hypothetical protein K488DRAFT_55521 [Vararia minispora EC-137]
MSDATDASPSFLPLLAQRFTTLIWQCLDADLTKSALFYAERYFSLDSTNHDARHLYATSLLRASQIHSALFLTNHPEQEQCASCFEIKAKCCTALGRHRQAREALELAVQIPAYTPTPAMALRTARAFPEEAVLHARSGLQALKGNLPDQARTSLRQALALNPMLWEAFEGLCQLGSIPEIEDLFPSRPAPIKRSMHDEPPLPPPPRAPVPASAGLGFFTPELNGGGAHTLRRPDVLPFRLGTVHPRESLFSDTSSFAPDNSVLQAHHRFRAPTSQNSRPLSSADEAGPAHKRLRPNAHSTAQPSLLRPPSAALTTAKSDSDSTAATTTARAKKARPALTHFNLFSSSGQPSAAQPKARAAAAPADAAGTRRSARLMGGGTNGTANGGATKAAPPPARDRRRAHTRTRSRSTESDGDDEPSVGSPRSDGSSWAAAAEQAAQDAYDAELADQYIYDLMRLFASATRALAVYDTALCMEELDKLPHKHQRSPHVMAMVGRAHYERTDYMAAERAFQAVRMLEPYRMWDMEVYSTLLWHLRRKVQLAFLAQELVAIDPRAPEAWIAIGNTFSLERQRAQALACFRRAQQLDPGCAYAFTLAGHETIDEDVDKAVLAFQTALRADPRHYNAWYGLGTCYLRMSKIRMAEYHYRKAAEIHPNNAVLLGCVGMAVERRGDRGGALALFNEAVKLSPENALVRYRRAKMLIGLKRYEAAIKDLEVLRDTSPDESNVVFQLARAYRLVGDGVRAAQMLAVARDVSPKSVGKIKKLMETVKDEEAVPGGGEDEKMDER